MTKIVIHSPGQGCMACCVLFSITVNREPTRSENSLIEACVRAVCVLFVRVWCACCSYVCGVSVVRTLVAYVCDCGTDDKRAHRQSARYILYKIVSLD